MKLRTQFLGKVKRQKSPKILVLFTALLVLASPLRSWAQFTFVTNNGTITITGYTGPGGNVTIPGTTNGYSVTSIKANAFYNKTNVTGVAIPDSVTDIGTNSFGNCSGLTNVTLGNGLTNIADSAFFACRKLLSMTIPDSVTSIGVQAFNACLGLTDVTIGKSVSSIGRAAFAGCSSLNSVTIPSGVTNIDFGVFLSCSRLTNINVNAANPSHASVDGVLFNKSMTMLIEFPGGLAGTYMIPNGTTCVGTNAFQGCLALTSVVIPDSVTNIGNWAFYDCFGLTNVTIGNSVTSIGIGAFYGCMSLTIVTIPDSVVSIGSSAFDSCSRLTSVTIGNSITKIGSYTFQLCVDLHQVYFSGNAPLVAGLSGSNTVSVFFYDHPGTVYYMQGTTGWGDFFGGFPTAVWLPQLQNISDGTTATATNGFGFNINWAGGQTVVVEVSTNLQNWTPVITNTLVNGTNAFWDFTWTNYPQRFYRVRSE
jgi:hypothetical protein